MQSKTTDKAGADVPPVWLVRVLGEHQPQMKGLWCTCSWKNTDAFGAPKHYTTFSAEHQAAEVHRALSDGVAALFEEAR
ncbi:hypothetical protein SEA_HELPFUL_74 [Mycobacterium phage Helpful]|uniref:Uncharacterized protein n=1 Tax=Mycobacterium phage Helpful TaxID=2652420 RepID=A0A5P8DAG4_9CAUD|nr:hypothetical protein SEA_HELPFUL_74 [Mycobacterium phage Helpful]